MQNFTQIDKDAPFPTAFQSIKWMHVIASIGPVFSLTGTLLTSVFGFGRVIYSMAHDGLFFKSLAVIHSKFKIPHLAFLFGYIFATILLITINLKNLLGFADICGFSAYVLVSTALLVIRYCPTNQYEHIKGNDEEDVEEDDEEEEETVFSSQSRPTLFLEEISEPLLSEFDDPELKLSLSNQRRRAMRGPLRRKYFRFHDKLKQKKFSITLIIFIFTLNIVLSGLFNYTKNYEGILLVLLVLSNLIVCFLLILFCEQTSDKNKISFKLPFVPFIPISSMALNIFLMMSSAFKDWIVFLVIVLTGLPIYFFYGLRNSKLS
jgi:amino acid transporter